MGGGHLVSIHDMFENLFLSEKAFKNFTDSTSGDFWIGANDLSTAGNWSWMDNTPFDFTDWDKGQPQNTSFCGAMIMQHGKWITDDCYKEKPFICLVYVTSDPTTLPPTTPTTTTTTTTPSPPKSCEDSWTFYNFTQSCYKVSDNLNWQDAEDRCKIDGAHLASIHSFEEAEFVADLAYWAGADVNNGNNQAWIGSYTNDNNTHWKWTDGTPFDYPNWCPGNPDFPGGESCMIQEIFLESYMSNWKAGQLNNYPCGTVLSRFVCKKSPK
uniref:C-type lectin domain-containing protein n=1 Tax=Panagrolaimus sp. ES5 TaxID=591445 RepID=A0AC34FKJ6_9BILA